MLVPPPTEGRLRPVLIAQHFRGHAEATVPAIGTSKAAMISMEALAPRISETFGSGAARTVDARSISAGSHRRAWLHFSLPRRKP